MPKGSKKKVTKTGGASSGLKPFNPDEIDTYVKKEMTKVKENRDYRKIIEDSYREVSIFSIVRALSRASKRLDDNIRLSHRDIYSSVEKSVKFAEGAYKTSSEALNYSQKGYKNSEIIVKSVSQEAKLLKTLYKELTDGKKNTMTAVESVRSETVTGINNVMKNLNAVKEQTGKNYDEQLNALNQLGVSNTKVIESVQKEGEKMRGSVSESIEGMKKSLGDEISEFKQGMDGVLEEVKGGLDSSMEEFDGKVSDSISEINDSVDSFKSEIAEFKSESLEMIKDSNEEAINQIKSVGGGLSKQNAENKEDIKETIASMGERMDRLDTKLDDTVEKMKEEVVGGAREQLEEMKGEVGSITNENRETLEAFKSDVQKYLKQEIADIRDYLSSIKAEIEMQKHVLTGLADRVRK